MPRRPSQNERGRTSRATASAAVRATVFLGAGGKVRTKEFELEPILSVLPNVTLKFVRTPLDRMKREHRLLYFTASVENVTKNEPSR